jgi:hypothetical protein
MEKLNLFLQKEEVVMNIKKLFIFASITLQASNMIYADQAAWNAAFTALTNVSDPKIAATLVKQSDKSSTEASNKLRSLGTPEAFATAAFVSKTNKTSFKTTFSATDVQRALRVAQGLEADTPPVNPNAIQLSDAIQANWTAAFAAFGTAQAIFDKTVTQKTMPASLTTTSVAYKNAQVIVQYLGKTGTGKGDYSGILNATDSTNFKTALTTAGANITVSSGGAQLTAKQTNGAALQQAILESQRTFNLLVPNTYDTSKPLIPAANLPA